MVPFHLLLACVLPLLVAITFFLVMKKTRAPAITTPPQHQLTINHAQLTHTNESSSIQANNSSIIDDKSSSSTTGTPTLSSPSLTLRFINGENPIRSFSCAIHLTIRELKSLVYSENGPTTSTRIIWINRGQMLQDEKRLMDYPMIQSDEIIHVHIRSIDPMILGQVGSIDQVSSSTASSAATTSNATSSSSSSPSVSLNDFGGRRRGGGGNFIIQGPHGLVTVPNNEPQQLLPQQQPIQPANLLWRTVFAAYISLLGLMWGVVVVFGGRLISLDSLLGLLFLTGMGSVGIVQAM